MSAKKKHILSRLNLQKALESTTGTYFNNPSEEVRGLFLFDDDALLGCQLGQVTDSRFVGGGQDRLVRLLGRSALRRFDLGGGRSLGRVGRLGHGRLRLGCVLSLNKKISCE